jgi:Flp pilus assembly protein TadG
MAAGLAVDMGYLRYQKRLMQAAADGAALAAATDQNLANAGLAAAQTDALYVAQVNGFTNGVNNTIVSVTSAPNVDPVSAVKVDIQEVYPTFFMVVAGFTNSTISAEAIATTGTSNGCMYALGVNDPIGITLNAGVDAPNCGISDNGSLNGTGNITSPSVGVYGAIAYGGVSTVAPVQIPEPSADPLAYLTPPPLGGCAPAIPAGLGVYNVPAGSYQSISVGTGDIYTFGAGLFILCQAPGLQITGNGIATSGVGGVTFYAVNGAGFTFSSSGLITLSAPTASPDGGQIPPGILIYEDPTDNSAADVSGAGMGNVSLNGTLYLPKAPLTIAGSVGGTNALTVAQNITITGSIVLDADSTSVVGGSPLENVSLVE